MALSRISALLETLTAEKPTFPPTDLYNETWLLRLVLDWYSRHPGIESPLSFNEGACWYSEGQIPSAFLARYKGDKLAESWTHADGLIGHFDVGRDGKTDVHIHPDAQQFTVVEAKIFSRLSPSVTNAAYYDQAARNVACIAETLRKANRRPQDMQHLAFYVLAPREQVESKIFDKYLALESIIEKVHRRVSAYEGERQDWFDNWFLPPANVIKVGTITWEDAISVIGSVDTESADQIASFYQSCLKYNGPGN